MKVIGNAVDPELFRPLDRQACKDQLGLSGFVVGYVGRLVESKGLMDIVEALPQISAEVTMVFVGSGDFQIALQKRVDELDLNRRVHFFPSRKMTDLPVLMNALDVLLLVSRTTPTWKEQFGRVIIEAHACETPVIGSDSGAISEVVGRGGLTVRESNSGDIAAAITRLKDDPALAREMGRMGRQQVESFYTWKRVSERMSDIYSEVAQGHQAMSLAAG